MSDASDEILSQIKDKKKGQNPGPEYEFYSKLRINKSRRKGLASILLIFFAFFVTLIFQNMDRGEHWLMVSLPLCLLGLLIVALPPTEEWVYSHWQVKARQYERHLTD